MKELLGPPARESKERDGDADLLILHYGAAQAVFVRIALEPGLVWKAPVDKASRGGILVVTCDPTFLRLGTLRHDPHKDPNDPASYRAGRYFAPGAALCVPAGNRTTASHYGRDVYTYWVEGGMSWAVPLFGGLAALAFQVNPDVQPAQIAGLWTTTATKTAVGPIVNPPKFIQAVRSMPGAKAP